MRGRMREGPSYAAGFNLGETMDGRAIGQVVESNDPNFKKGDYVRSMYGFREWYVAPGKRLEKVVPGAPLSSYIGALGMPGFTAYVGLFRYASLKDGERVFVSAAAGAVGAVACQIAKAKGCYVVGTAGTDEKCDWLKKEAGVDVAINYKKGDLKKAIKEACPEGIDVYFENVGGEHLEAALENMREGGRIAVCGMISTYNDNQPRPLYTNLTQIIAKRLIIKGFLVGDNNDMQADFVRDMGAWRKAGKMKWRETIYDGIERAPEALIGLFHGDNFGKMVVRVGPEKAV
jgi:NADPH-dependent curcumin reductase CurA